MSKIILFDFYSRFLRSIRPDNMGEYNKQMQRFNVGEDCPVFDGNLLLHNTVL